MLSAQQIRKILGKHGKEFTDNEIIKIREFFYSMAQSALDCYKRIRIKELNSQEDQDIC